MPSLDILAANEFVDPMFGEKLRPILQTALIEALSIICQQFFKLESQFSQVQRSLLRKINHEETKSTKVFSAPSSFSSFLRG
jgi:hypothetical protein